MSISKAGDSKFLGLSGQLSTNLELILRNTFQIPDTSSDAIGPSSSSSCVAVRLRRRKVKPGEPSRIILMERDSFVCWLQDGGTPALWLSADEKSVCAKFGNPVSKTVSVARYVANCRAGQALTYKNKNHFDLRKGNLKPDVSAGRGSLPRVKDVLEAYRKSARATMIDRDIGLFLVHPERVDLGSFTERPAPKSS